MEDRLDVSPVKRPSVAVKITKALEARHERLSRESSPAMQNNNDVGGVLGVSYQWTRKKLIQSHTA